MTGYELSRNFFDWCFENPEKISPNHIAIYFFALEHQNRLGGKEKFGFPTQMAMDALGIKKHQTYIKYFNDLVEFGFFKLIQKSTNQYSANIISISFAMPKNGKALDKAFIKHRAKQTESNGQSISSIDKQLNKEQLTIDIYPTFDDFWNLYANKKDKEACVPRWNKLTQKEKEAIMEYLPAYIQSTPNKEFRKNPKTFLHNKSWNNEITTNKSTADRISEAGQQQALNFIFNK
jgi:hypothetical protein